MSEDLWNEAIAEAYASAPSDEVILHTLELRHPAFMINGTPTPIRVVSDYGTILEMGDPDLFGHELILEMEAPVDAGKKVRFISCMFELNLPSQEEGRIPEVEIILDNVTSEISAYLDEATKERAMIELTYRQYLASDITHPQFILNGMTLSSVSMTLTRVTGTASFVDLVNKSFPGKVYRPEEFRGLVSG